MEHNKIGKKKTKRGSNQIIINIIIDVINNYYDTKYYITTNMLKIIIIKIFNIKCTKLAMRKGQ